jgi:hypothetical protein
MGDCPDPALGLSRQHYRGRPWLDKAVVPVQPRNTHLEPVTTTREAMRSDSRLGQCSGMTSEARVANW